jgi:AcrR family transcriptional regulator
MSTIAATQEAPRRPDRRVRRTRRALGDALIALLNEKRYEAVTVQDILDQADVGRSTFYAHFVDKDSLLLDAFREMRRQHARPGLAGEGGDEGAFAWSRETFGWSLDVLHQFEAASTLYCSMVGSPGCTIAVEEMERELDGIVRRDLATMAGMHPARVPDMVVRFVVTAFMSILPWWLEHPDALSVEEVDQVFRVLTLPGAAAALGVSVEVGPPPEALSRVTLDGPRLAPTLRPALAAPKQPGSPFARA